MQSAYSKAGRPLNFCTSRDLLSSEVNAAGDQCHHVPSRSGSGFRFASILVACFHPRQDQDGNVSYREFVPFAFDLLQKMASQMPQLSGRSSWDSLRQILMQACLPDLSFARVGLLRPIPVVHSQSRCEKTTPRRHPFLA